jgi:hypothetical protein
MMKWRMPSTLLLKWAALANPMLRWIPRQLKLRP